jgi:transcriptional regulator with XRE-family HTH domain
MDALEEALAVRRVRARLRDGSARAVRLSAGLSLADVERAAGASAGQAARWESGKNTPSFGSALKLARLYGELERLVAAEVATGAVAGQQEGGAVAAELS